jgi:hypothetical protein
MPGGPKLAVEVAVHRVLKQHQGSFLPCLTSIDLLRHFDLNNHAHINLIRLDLSRFL